MSDDYLTSSPRWYIPDTFLLICKVYVVLRPFSLRYSIYCLPKSTTNSEEYFIYEKNNLTYSEKIQENKM